MFNIVECMQNKLGFVGKEQTLATPSIKCVLL